MLRWEWFVHRPACHSHSLPVVRLPPGLGTFPQYAPATNTPTLTEWLYVNRAPNRSRWLPFVRPHISSIPLPLPQALSHLWKDVLSPGVLRDSPSTEAIGETQQEVWKRLTKFRLRLSCVHNFLTDRKKKMGVWLANPENPAEIRVWSSTNWCFSTSGSDAYFPHRLTTGTTETSSPKTKRYYKSVLLFFAKAGSDIGVRRRWKRSVTAIVPCFGRQKTSEQFAPQR